MNNSLKTSADVVINIIEQRGADCIRKSISKRNRGRRTLPPLFLPYFRQILRATLSAAKIMGYMVGAAVKSG